MGVADSYVQFTLRLPEDLKETVKKIGQKNCRSLNSEIIVMLQQGCEKYECELALAKDKPK